MHKCLVHLFRVYDGKVTSITCWRFKSIKRRIFSIHWWLDHYLKKTVDSLLRFERLDFDPKFLLRFERSRILRYKRYLQHRPRYRIHITLRRTSQWHLIDADSEPTTAHRPGPFPNPYPFTTMTIDPAQDWSADWTADHITDWTMILRTDLMENWWWPRWQFVVSAQSPPHS